MAITPDIQPNTPDPRPRTLTLSLTLTLTLILTLTLNPNLTLTPTLTLTFTLTLTLVLTLNPPPFHSRAAAKSLWRISMPMRTVFPTLDPVQDWVVVRLVRAQCVDTPFGSGRCVPVGIHV